MLSSGGNLVALVVEDEPDIQHLLTLILSSLDASVTALGNGDAAVEVLNKVHLGKLPLDIIVTDHNHSGLRGLDLIRRIRSFPDDWTMQGGLRLRHLPIILQSGYVSELNLSDIKDTVPIFQKPYRMEEMAKSVDQAIRDYRDRILADLHHVGLGVKWEGGRLTLAKCYVLDERKGFESKYIAAEGPTGITEAANAYKRLIMIEDRQWSAERAVAELEGLLNAPSTTEREMQRFFRLHPEFLYQNCFIDYWAEPQLEDRSRGEIYKPDFVLKSPMLPERPWSWQVLDLKRHNVPLLSNRRFHAALSHHVQRVITQLRDYSEYFDNPANQGDIERKFGSPIRKPKLMAVIGRLPKDNDLMEFARLSSRIPDVSVTTYDEVLEFRRYQVERRRTLLL